MIPAAQITNWRARAPWANDDDVEQDLLISRAIVELFNNPFLHERLAFRGGTALHKLLLPPTRYSEDIDLVFLRSERIGPVFDEIRKALAWFDKPPRSEIGMFPKLYFKFTTTSGATRRIKIEVATREGFSAARTIEVPYKINSTYFSGEASVRTYALEELLATKLRAHYQRAKGRDLYDLWDAARQRTVDFAAVYALFLEYWANTGLKPVTRRDLRKDMMEKHKAGIFPQVIPLLVPGNVYDPATAEAWFDATIVPCFPL